MYDWAIGGSMPYTALWDTSLTRTTLVEGLIALFSSAPSTHCVVHASLTTTASHQFA